MRGRTLFIAAVAAGVLFTASVVSAEISLDKVKLVFGEVEVGSASATGTITVTNDGSEDAIVKTASIFELGTTNFRMLNPLTEALTIPPGGDHTFQFVFEPQSTGDKTAQFRVQLDGSVVPDAIAPLEGTGTPPSVQPVTPSMGTIGTIVTCKAEDYGTKKPKIWVQWTNTKGRKRTKKLKVVTHIRTEVTALVKSKLAPGTYEVMVKPAGRGQEVLNQGEFEIVLPAVSTVNLEAGGPGEQVVAQGMYFGDKKAKPVVRFVYNDPNSGKEKSKKCKFLKAWHHYDGYTGESTIRFLIPKVPAVTGKFVLKTKVGSGILKYDFEVTEKP